MTIKQPSRPRPPSRRPTSKPSTPTPSTPTKQTPKPTSKKQKSKQTTSKCWDWILTTGNTHYAKNRSTFLTYRRAPTKIANNRVLGVGDVRLYVQRGPSDPRTTTLLLKDVLHMPDARCNGLSLGKYMDMNRGVVVGDIGGDESERVVARDGDGGEGVWFAEGFCGCERVVLAGDPGGESLLREGGVYMLSVIVGREEGERLWGRVREREWA